MLKRAFDFLSSFVGCLFFFPLFCICAIWIKLDSFGPVFFIQKRVGRYGVPFYIYKFRTMKMESSGIGITVGKDQRITHSGQFLRKYKIDELPQLFNVIKGDMSLVGPRPEVQQFIDCYPPDERAEILSVRPGITDRAAIEMVDENMVLSAYDDPVNAYITEILPIKRAFYLQYIRKNSFLGDLKIILATLVKVMHR